MPLAVLVTAANVHDSQVLLPMLDCVPAVLTPAGRRRWRPDKLHADKAYDVRALRERYADAASTSASPARASSPPSGSAGTAGSSNRACPG